MMESKTLYRCEIKFYITVKCILYALLSFNYSSSPLSAEGTSKTPSGYLKLDSMKPFI